MGKEGRKEREEWVSPFPSHLIPPLPLPFPIPSFPFLSFLFPSLPFSPLPIPHPYLPFPPLTSSKLEFIKASLCLSCSRDCFCRLFSSEISISCGFLMTRPDLVMEEAWNGVMGGSMGVMGGSMGDIYLSVSHKWFYPETPTFFFFFCIERVLAKGKQKYVEGKKKKEKKSCLSFPHSIHQWICLITGHYTRHNITKPCH